MRAEPAFPLTAVVNEVTIEKLTELQEILKSYRVGGGTVDRRDFFSSQAWVRVNGYIEKQFQSQHITWSDQEWFGYMLRRLRGEDTVKQMGGQETIMKVAATVVDETPIGFTDMEFFQRDGDRFLSGLQRAIELSEPKLRNVDLTRAEWASLPKFREAAPRTQLPEMWEFIIGHAQNSLLAVRDPATHGLDYFVMSFTTVFNDHRLFLASLKAKTGCCLSTIGPRNRNSLDETSHRESSKSKKETSRADTTVAPELPSNNGKASTASAAPKPPAKECTVTTHP